MSESLVEKLTERQRDCLRLVNGLQTTDQIAAELGISPHTVNTHIERAMLVLGINSRRAAALMVEAFERERPDKLPTDITRLADLVQPHPSPEPATVAIGRNRNDLIWSLRLAWAVAALVGLCLAIGALGAAIEQLSKWRASFINGAPAQTPRSHAGGR